jgi:membrane protein implicated in regulation of membrane protease activity
MVSLADGCAICWSSVVPSVNYETQKQVLLFVVVKVAWVSYLVLRFVATRRESPEDLSNAAGSVAKALEAQEQVIRTRSQYPQL